MLPVAPITRQCRFSLMITFSSEPRESIGALTSDHLTPSNSSLMTPEAVRAAVIRSGAFTENEIKHYHIIADIVHQVP